MRLLVLDIGEWVCFPETVHEFYAHLAEMIEQNQGRGLKMISEENLEVKINYPFVLRKDLKLVFFFKALHKIVRKNRESKARLQNSEVNLTDILTR